MRAHLASVLVKGGWGWRGRPRCSSCGSGSCFASVTRSSRFLQLQVSRTYLNGAQFYWPFANLFYRARNSSDFMPWSELTVLPD